jgi:hypothetical protein
MKKKPQRTRSQSAKIRLICVLRVRFQELIVKRKVESQSVTIRSIRVLRVRFFHACHSTKLFALYTQNLNGVQNEHDINAK